MIWIAVDAMGGDEAPRQIVDGALAAARHFDLGVLLVGRADAIEREVRRVLSEPFAARGESKGVKIVDTPDAVDMHDPSPAATLRRTHDALKTVGLSECPHCHEAKPPHRVCANCGYYRGRQARAVKED